MATPRESQQAVNPDAQSVDTVIAESSTNRTDTRGDKGKNPQPAVKSDVQPIENSSATSAKGAEKVADKGKKPQQAPQSTGEQKLSGKELKAKKQAEKQARRAAEKAQSGAPSAGEPGPSSANGQATGSSTEAGKQSTKAKQGQQPPRGAQAGTAQHRRTASQVPGPQAMPVRPKAAQSGGAKEPRKVSKEVGLFGHLYNQPKRFTMEGVSKDIHPAVLALGFQMSNYVVCGSNARCVAMLLAFKKAIQSYTTPANTSLARHLTSHFLSPQIDYLKSHRPISVSMGNAIRWLKDYIIHIDPDTEEKEAKHDICSAIDTFIRERITVADTAISGTASSKVRNGSTVVTFAKSSIVEQSLLRAHNEGKRFKVIVIDSRPLFEGKNLARSLAAAGIETQYMLLSAAGHAIRHADLVLLGAHAMMANGRLYSRIGTASVAMLAHSRDVPVIVCCESIKFTDRVALDSIVQNEIAPPDELLLPSSTARSTLNITEAAKSGSQKGKDVEDKESVVDGGLARWRDVPGLQLLNILFDVTPADFIDMVVTEYGSLPPTSVPVVHRISTERDVRA